jgi:drug/metabolite transporter (DMT)-like permease
MALSALSFSAMAAFIRIAGETIPTMELVVFRSAFIIVVSIPLMAARGVPMIGTHQRGLVLRGLIGFLSMSGFYWTLTRMPVADAIVIQYTSPVFTTLFAWVFLRERTSPQLWLVIAVCMLGVVAIARPGFGGDPVVALVGVLSAAAAGGAYTVVRSLAGREHALTIIFYFPLVSLPLGLAFAVPEWVWPSPWTWLAILAACIPSYIGQILLTKGLELEPAGRASTVTYLSIGFGTVIGWAFMNESPHLMSIAGMLLIVGAISLMNSRVERGARAFVLRVRERLAVR